LAFVDYGLISYSLGCRGNEMKILHVVIAFPLGGIEKMLVEILNDQTRNNKTMLIIINDIIDTELLASIDPRVEVVRLNRSKGKKSVVKFIRLNALCYFWNPDIIHIHHPPIARFIIVNRQKQLTTLHGIKIFDEVPKGEMADIACYVAISEYIKEIFIKKYPQFTNKTIVINNGISFKKYAKKTKYSTRKYRLAIIGRLVHEIKGQDIVISALPKIPIESIHLDIIGEGPSKGLLADLVTKLHLDSTVSFLGKILPKMLETMLSSYELIIIPSRGIEAFGLVAVEAIAAGVPVLVSDEGAPIEIIRKTGGYIFQNGDVEDCAKSIMEVIDDYKWGNIAARCWRAQDIAQKNYDLDLMIEEYTALYGRMITGVVSY
jgi:glycosyltransferase involved in cell wall biosynthesis